MRYLLLALAIASTATAEDRLNLPGNNVIPSEKMQQIQKIKSERKQQLLDTYQIELKNAPTAASRTEVMKKYGNLLNPDKSAISKTLPAEQYLKLREKTFNAEAENLNKITKGEVPATVKNLTSDVVREKAVEDFQDDNGKLMRKFMEAQGNELNKLAGEKDKPRVQWGPGATSKPAAPGINYNAVGTSDDKAKNNTENNQ